jgi:NitT/TauT family transport system ATP-binding protein
VRSISKHFIDGVASVARVLDGISLEVRTREFLTIVGPSGCGKTTLLKIISGLLEPSSGGVRLQGRTVEGPPAEMVYLSQQYSKSLLPWRTVMKNVEFPLEHRPGIGRDERIERAMQSLRDVGLGGVPGRFPWQLSGGMQQRVTIARALAARPSVLLLDEPFSSVDALTRMELQDLILDTWQRHALTVVLVTHDIDEAVYLADRVAVMLHPPASIIETLVTDLPRPREQMSTRASARFLELRNDLYGRVRQPRGAPAQ